MALGASEKERKEPQERLLQGMETRLEASVHRKQALRAALEARTGGSSAVGPDLEAVLSPAQPSTAVEQAAAKGGEGCSVAPRWQICTRLEI